MKKTKNLTSLIMENKLCIRDNPFGIMRLWPNSYIELFYNDFCNDLYKKNKSPNILEVNQLNKLNLELWKLFFDNPRVDNFKEEILLEKNNMNIKYDFIIVNDLSIIQNRKSLKGLLKIKKSSGIIVFENIGRKFKDILKIYLNYFFIHNIDIYDYRLNRYLLNNGLLIISKGNKKLSYFKELKRICKFLFFILMEFTISIFTLVLRK